MLFDDGVVYICTLTNVAENGRMPKEVLTKIAKFWFAERTIGYNRQYLARGVNQQIDMLIRIHQYRQARVNYYAVLGNGEQYRITNVQHLIDDNDGLRYTDLTLERLDTNYDLDE